MVTYFDRSAVQVYFERKMSCSDPFEFAQYREDIAQIILNRSDSNAIVGCVEKDIQGQFERNALALFQALSDLDNGVRMWAAVKLYYSVFYALRAELHLAGISIVRCHKIFLTSGAMGSTLKVYNNKVKGDHGIAIELTKKNFADSDILQFASVDEKNAYEWLKDIRELVQYKLRSPPECIDFDPFFPAKDISIADQVALFLADKEPYYCFDPDFAALAIPVKRFQITSHKVKDRGIVLSDNFKSLADRLLQTKGSVQLLKPFLW